MKKHLLNLLKGIAIGIANVIPGFSGGTMAVMLKIYDLFVDCFANFFNDFKNVVKKGWSLFVGILIGVLLALVTIVKLLEIIPFITVMFFVGLIFGSIPAIFKKCKEGENLKIADIIGFIVAVAIIVALPLIQTQNNQVMEYSGLIFAVMFFLGIICSSAMVIPGVSGSLVLMAFGFYAFLMNTMKEYLTNMFSFSTPHYWDMFFTIACFAIGCVIGLVFVSKLIKKLTKKYPKTVYCTIFGLLLASPFSIILTTQAKYEFQFDVVNIIFGIVTLVLGVLIVLGGEKLSNRNSSNKEVK